MPKKDTSSRGFGSMDEKGTTGGRQQRRPRCARKRNRSREIDPEEAREAGRKGGERSHGGHSRDGQNSAVSQQSGSHGAGSRSDSSEQHAEAGRQSHKNNEHSDQSHQRGSQGGSHNQESGDAEKMLVAPQSNMPRPVIKATRKPVILR
jgi:hypothetical protein